MAKGAEPKAEIEATVVMVENAPEGEDDPITEEWEEAIYTALSYRKLLQSLIDEKEILSGQKTVLSKRIFDLQNEIRLLEAKILLTFERVIKVNYSAAQMIMIAEGQLHAID